MDFKQKNLSLPRFLIIKKAKDRTKIPEVSLIIIIIIIIIIPLLYKYFLSSVHC